jgi:hypothetical protein
MFLINDAMTSMTFTATVTGIDFTGLQTPNDPNDNLVAAHIHAGPTAIPGMNAGVVWGFFGNPFNDNNLNDGEYSSSTGVGGTISGNGSGRKWNHACPVAQHTEAPLLHITRISLRAARSAAITVV